MRSSTLGVLVLLLSMAGCAGLKQTEDQVYKRHSGERLAYWMSVWDGAALHWPYAWAAVAAYQDEHDRPYRKPLELKPECPEPHAYLESRNWELWRELPLLRDGPAPAQSTAARMREKHLRAEVWSNRQANQVIIAFGGTAFSSLEDWKGNFRWALRPMGNIDAFNILTDDFMPAFRRAFSARSMKTEHAWLRNAELVATGHSQGAGLAQRFAYSLQASPDMPRVLTVYAFDPSPVTGKREIPYFRETAKGLTIYRVYNRGESLAGVRSVLAWGNPRNERNQGQVWIDVRYRSQWSWRTLLPSGTVKAHGMYSLACFMKKKLDAGPPPLATRP